MGIKKNLLRKDSTENISEIEQVTLSILTGKSLVNQAYCPEGHSTIKEKKRKGACCNSKLIIAGYRGPGRLMRQ